MAPRSRLAGVEGILFDAVGTLIHPDPPVGQVYAAAAAKLGSRLTASEVADRFRKTVSHARAWSPSTVTSEALERQFWRRIVGEVLSDVAQVDLLFDALWDHFADARHWQVDPHAADIFERLEAVGMRVGLASNFDSRLLTIARDLPPLDRCQAIFVSSQIGHRKPSRQFFSAIESAWKLQPGDLLIVGDDRQCDWLAAKQAGWHALLLAESVDETDTIRSLTELPTRLGLE